MADRLKLGITIILLIVNNVIEIIIPIVVVNIGFDTRGLIAYMTTMYIFGCQFFNTALILLFASANLDS